MNVDQSKLNGSVSSEIDSIIGALVANSEVTFKSQQRGEAEPNESEKAQIALKEFGKNKTNFLLRFGKHLDQHQLGFFDQFTDCKLEPADYQEIELVLNDLKRQRRKRERNLQVKNRRYDAMLKMIKGDSYFSEIEMMKRNPLLYEQLVGQYLSPDEKRRRDKYEMNEDVTFVKILMEGIERDNAEQCKKVQQQKEDSQMEESESSSDEDEIPVSLKSPKPSTSRWGEFEEDAMQTTRSKKSAPMVTAAERLLFKEEFISTMYQNFVDGKDEDFFDYNTVDNDDSYDCIEEMDHDAEDKYFDSEDPEEEPKLETHESSEDELDIFMSALNQHPAVCDLANRINDKL